MAIRRGGHLFFLVERAAVLVDEGRDRMAGLQKLNVALFFNAYCLQKVSPKVLSWRALTNLLGFILASSCPTQN